MRVKALLPYKATIQGSITTMIPSLLVVVLMTLFSACQSEETTGDDVHQTSLAFHVSTNRVATRMSDAVTQQKEQEFRGIQDLWLFPFKGDGISLGGNVIADAKDILDENNNGKPLKYIEGDPLNYCDENSPVIPEETARFLCYAKAKVPEDADPFTYGSLQPSITGSVSSITPATVTFTPKEITASVLSDNGLEVITSDPTDENNKNKDDRFIYPPELYYFANSKIKTSMDTQIDYYNLSWSDVLQRYENSDATYESGVVSVAIINPLHYAVGCLQIGLVVNALLEDAVGTVITLSAGTTSTEGTFPLTGVFVTGQRQQGYDFTPVSTSPEKILYDKSILGVTMGDSKTTTPATATPTAFSNTLVLQTIDGENERFALEFLNNSGAPFQGADGEVAVGGKFYLVGTIQVTTGHAGTEAYKNRVFTKDYITQGVVKIESLKQAYTYLPDLMDPRLEVTLKLEPDWIQSTTTNVPL